jgi:hypothetical protein
VGIAGGVDEDIDADGNRRAQRGQQDTALTGPKAQLKRSLLASRMISPSVTVQLQLFGAAQDLKLSAFSATVYVEGAREQGETYCRCAVHTENDVLNFQPRRIRRTARCEVGNDHSEIPLQVQRGRKLGRNGLSDESNFRLSTGKAVNSQCKSRDRKAGMCDRRRRTRGRLV